MDDYRDLDAVVDEARLAALAAYDAAADKFILKVKNGYARSNVTYVELKAARELSRKAERFASGDFK